MKPWRVVLCGSKYAQMYAPVLIPSLGFRLVAILAQGSVRSRKLAKALGVPLIHDAADAPEADAACVAIGGSAGCDLAREFLLRGVHVLQEHPITSVNASRVIREARRTRTAYHVNAHFGDLDAPQQFITACRRESRRNVPLSVVVMVDARLVYGTLDILARAIDAVPVRVRTTERTRKHVSFGGSVGRTEFVIVTRRSEGADGDDYHFGCNLTVVFASATVTLGSLTGPVYRTQPLRGLVRGKIWQMLPGTAPDWDALIADRLRANHWALMRLRADAERKKLPAEQDRSLQRRVMRLREQISDAMNR